MPLETDEQIAARRAREKQVRSAWRQFKATATKKVRRRLKRLPPTGIYGHDPDT